MTKSLEEMMEDLIQDAIARDKMLNKEITCREFFGGDPPKVVGADDDEGAFVTVLLDGKKAEGDFKSVNSGVSAVKYMQQARETQVVEGNFTVVWEDEFKEPT